MIRSLRRAFALGNTTSLLALLLAALLVIFPACRSSARAKAHLENGNRYLDLRQFVQAKSEYRRAIEMIASIEHFATRSVIAAEYAQKLRARGELDQAFEMLELARGAAAKH